MVIDAVNRIVGFMNAELKPYPSCAVLMVKAIDGAWQYVEPDANDKHFVMSFSVSPSNAKFEVYVTVVSGEIQPLSIDHISRTNMYKGQDGCMNVLDLKKICYCM